MRFLDRLLPSLLVIAYSLGPVSVAAQPASGPASIPASPTASTARSAARQVQALRVEDDSAPRIDGRLDEDIWRSATPATDFLQKEPREGMPASEPTEVRFCYDGSALYIGARMRRAGRDVRSTLTRRDNSGNSERIIISLDTYRDGRTAYTFSLTADGTRTDYYHAADSEFNRDFSFDPVWEGVATVTDEEWYAEMRIPFSQLRFTDTDAQEWGLNINHWVPAINEDRYWRLVPKTESGWSSRFGALTGITGVRPSRRLEITPYAAGDLTHDPRVDARDPFRSMTGAGGRAGLDVKMGLGPNLTLDATINPDFGQVEADPAEVNLSAYETVYDERRPFFVEGAQLLRGNGPNYFYSRRIGAPPRGGVPGAYNDIPSATTILGAAKLSGRLASGLSVGALAAVTARETAEGSAADGSDRRSAIVEPLSGWGVARVQQEFGADASTAGVMLAGVTRALDDGDPLAAQLTRNAVAGGGDWVLRFDGGGLVLSGFAGFSHVQGSRDAILRLQRSSARYYQRPDQDYLRVDTSRTSLTGGTVSLSLERTAGEHWLWGFGGGTESPGFELNDAGRLQTSDDIDSWGWVRYRETTPTAHVHAWGVELYADAGWNYGGMRHYGGAQLAGDVTWKNYMNSRLWVTYRPEVMSDDLTRGGPAMLVPRSWQMGGGITSSYAEQTVVNANANAQRDEIGGWNYWAGVGLTMRPGGRVEISINPSYSRSLSRRQYVTTLPGGGDATWGRRYIFAAIDRGTISMQVRVNYAFTPDLTLEGYAEPFAASGRYHDFGELPRGGALHLARFPDDAVRRDAASGAWVLHDGGSATDLRVRDFAFLSFRSNLVLRWEWLRGSTFFFIWQQNHAATRTGERLARPDDLFDALMEQGSSFLALKLTWWIPAA